ncbi:MAG: YMGG-like glycine zipper-containing protein [Bacteroidota bacterium]|nr:YMGG-like glycine zipper-containing protein [Bacteroidota bacterium]
MKKSLKRLFAAFLLVATLIMFTCEYSYAQKKHWSHRKKDAVIGGAAGAGVGAAVSHKKGKGALIGGAVGAAAGYLHGKSKDKKGQ